jgi:hypothetical protein
MVEAHEPHVPMRIVFSSLIASVHFGAVTRKMRLKIFQVCFIKIIRN